MESTQTRDGRTVRILSRADKKVDKHTHRKVCKQRAGAVKQKQNWCKVSRCRQVAFSSRKSHLAPFQARHENSAFALVAVRSKRRQLLGEQLLHIRKRLELKRIS